MTEEVTETEAAKQARIAAEKAQAEKRTAEIEAQKKAAESSVKKSDDTATNTLADTAQDLTKKAGNAASDAGNWFSDMFSNGSKGLKEFFKNTSGWGVAGIAGGALLAWTIGEAFGGGGLFGMIVSLMLMPFLAILGRDFAQNNLAPAVQQAHGQSPERSPSLTQGPVPEHTQTASLENSNTQEIAEAARRQADVLVRGNTVRIVESQQESLPPRLPHASPPARMLT